MRICMNQESKKQEFIYLETMKPKTSIGFDRFTGTVSENPSDRVNPVLVLFPGLKLARCPLCSLLPRALLLCRSSARSIPASLSI